MTELFRTLLTLVIVALAVTGLMVFVSWWMQDARRLRRALRRALGRQPEVEALSPQAGRGAGLDFDSGALAVLWDRGRSGLVFGLEEVLGAELIVDGRVAARVRRNEAQRLLDELPRQADQVALRLMFDDPRQPDFEMDLMEGQDPLQAVRTGRRWLAHVEAVLRLPQAPANPPQPIE